MQKQIEFLRGKINGPAFQAYLSLFRVNGQVAGVNDGLTARISLGFHLVHSAALRFIPKEDLEKEVYGEYGGLFSDKE